MAEDHSDAFRAGLTTHRAVVSRVDVVQVDGTVLYEGLPFTTGSVDVDESTRQRRSLNLQVSPVDLEGADLEPRDVDDLLAPAGNELQVWSGVELYPSGAQELLPVGRFGVKNPARPSRFGALSVSGGDRCARVERARFLRPYKVPAGALVLDQITSLLTAAMPAGAPVEVYDFTGSLDRCRPVVYERERWEAIDALAAQIGAEVFPDPQGRWFIRPVPEVPTLDDIDEALEAGAPVVWRYTTGDGGTMSDWASSMDSSRVYNAVVAEAELGEDAERYAYAAVAILRSGPFDYDDPDFGPAPRYFAANLASTRSQVQKTARTLLGRSQVFGRQVDPMVSPNAATDTGDWCVIEEPVTDRTRVGGDTTVHRIPGVVRKFSLPLQPGEMPVEVRQAFDVEVQDGGAP